MGRAKNEGATVIQRVCILVSIWISSLQLATHLYAQLSAKPDATAATAELLLVLGAAGEEQYRTEFDQAAKAWQTIAQDNGWSCTTISEDRSLQPGHSAPESPPTHRQQIESHLTNLPTSATQLWIVLIGHGTTGSSGAKFNLVGPDLSAGDLKGWLSDKSLPVTIVNCSSSSAPFLVELSGKNRTVVSATRSGAEVNYSRFGGRLAAALLDESSDLDHDREISLLEAFLKASNETDRFYKSEARLTTEHALLDDNHDRLGTPASFYQGLRVNRSAVGGKPIDGQQATRQIIRSLPGALRMTVQQSAARHSIEQQIDQLRSNRSWLSEGEYYDALEKLLLELAALYQAAEL
jgi:hypothetical protein